MTSTFFARPVRFFGSVAVLVLCAVFFLTPFALRGARMSLERMENNVKDWLPDDFPETKELEWFGEHFVGERFVLVTWPGCTEDDPRFELMVKKLSSELTLDDVDQEIGNATAQAGNDPEKQTEAVDRVQVRQMGDRLGLFATGDYHENWAGQGEKWLQGDDGAWYFITPEGKLYRWKGEANLPGFLWRSGERLLKGTNTADGELVGTVGEPPTSGKPNEYHADPRRLTARLFKTLTTGPDVVKRLASEGGTLWPIGNIADERKSSIARRQAYDRLTGVLFGPVLPQGFSWELDDFRHRLPKHTLEALPDGWEEKFTQFIDGLVEQKYSGRRDDLVNAAAVRQTRHWDALFEKFGVAPPPRQTCLVVTLSDAGKRDMRRVIGRELLGKPLGKLLDVAANECDIPADSLRLGGPPVDNVAIDEEGTITLFRLIGYSAVIGIGLSLLCFRSVKITIMVFFVGGVAAFASLSIVWWCGASVDAVLMSMPSLVYVLGLSGAVHIVNYYREAVLRGGLEGAPERALGHGWGPCTLAAFTTALGLVSLYASNLAPIKKFGLYSAIGVMATLALLFTYLPAALQIFPPGYRQRRDDSEPTAVSFSDLVTRFWERVGGWVIRRHGWVTAGCLTLCVAVGLGLPRINTSVQLLELFDGDAKIIRDYRWLETHLGKLVPMELVIRAIPQVLRPSLDDLQGADESVVQNSPYQLAFADRLGMASHVQKVMRGVFGENGQNIVGQGMSAATFAPDLPGPGTARLTFNSKLESHRDELLAEDYVRIDRDPQHRGSELWRVSLRLGALNGVDYGEFVHEQKLAVEPVLTAYRYRDSMLRAIDESTGGKNHARVRLCFLGAADPPQDAPPLVLADVAKDAADGDNSGTVVSSEGDYRIDQTLIFTSTLKDLLVNASFPTTGPSKIQWHDPVTFLQTKEQAASNGQAKAFSEGWARVLEQKFDCVVLVRDHPAYDTEFIRKHAKLLIDVRDHQFDLDTSLTAAERGDPIHVVYTGVVPIVYKAQRALLNSLVRSIALAFVMIALVMMVVLRDWGGSGRPSNWVNVPGGMLSMVPNVFPVILVFGAMGHMGVLVDIGTMMCASVAMGVAVDDTIHYLTWFRHGIRQGMDRNAAIIEAYRRVGTAMTQTTLIGGLGLAVFALSTFTPTQRFGVMMVVILAAVLVGDLILLPAILAGPLGRAFCPRRQAAPEPSPDSDSAATEPDASPATVDDEEPAPVATPHSTTKSLNDAVIRTDHRHRWPGGHQMRD